MSVFRSVFVLTKPCPLHLVSSSSGCSSAVPAIRLISSHKSGPGSSSHISKNRNSEWRSNQIRHFHWTRSCRHLVRDNRAYDADGKTSVNILNDELGAPLMVDSFNQSGFKLNNGSRVIGPMVLFPKTVLGWDVEGPHDVTPESLALFKVLVPKPDILVIGVGDKGAQLPTKSVRFLKELKINIEVLSTHHAVTTFNFLSGERRLCAGLMIPPTKIVWTAFDLANSRLAYTEEEQAKMGLSRPAMHALEYREFPMKPDPEPEREPEPPKDNKNDDSKSK